MSDGGRGRASLGVKVWKSSQKWNAQRSGVRSIAWLDAWRGIVSALEEPCDQDSDRAQGGPKQHIHREDERSCDQGLMGRAIIVAVNIAVLSWKHCDRKKNR